MSNPNHNPSLNNLNMTATNMCKSHLSDVMHQNQMFITILNIKHPNTKHTQNSLNINQKARGMTDTNRVTVDKWRRISKVSSATARTNAAGSNKKKIQRNCRGAAMGSQKKGAQFGYLISPGPRLKCYRTNGKGSFNSCQTKNNKTKKFRSVLAKKASE